MGRLVVGGSGGVEPGVLWRPRLDGSSRVERFMSWLARRGTVRVDDYGELWDWSVTDLEGFWGAVWEYFAVTEVDSSQVVLSESRMPGAVWFPGVAVNYAEVMLRMPGRADDDVVVVSRSQSRPDVLVTAAQLRAAVACARRGLERVGVGRGDRVVAYSPNVPETLVLMLAAASLGAVFASCPPEFGARSVIDRWSQIEPKFLLAVDGYRYGAKAVDSREAVRSILASLPSVETVVRLSYLDQGAAIADDEITWDDFCAESGELQFEPMAFADPLYVLFSSGTTGLPKPIVHGHGGITVEHLKAFAFHSDVGPGDRFFWYTTTGWMMWNYLVSGLGVGATIVLFDGNLAYPDQSTLWRLADELDVTTFGVSAPFLMETRRQGLRLGDVGEFKHLRVVGSTGAPLPREGYEWVYAELGDDVHLSSVSGGTDLCTAVVGTVPIAPVYAGAMSVRMLGCAVDSFSPSGESVRGELGELVVTRPMPSMPVGFWGDESGERLASTYFDMYPGLWRQGDWISITPGGACVISGRSDATLNRGGVRLGTADFYSVVEALPEVLDSLIVHLEATDGSAGNLVLFVALVDGQELDDELERRIAVALRTELSPRHVPDVIAQLTTVPRTLTGKKLEVPVKRLLRGARVEDVASPGSIQGAEALEDIVASRSRLHPN